MVAASEQHRAWMRLALAEAALSEHSADVPVGALVIDPAGQVVGRGRNRREADADPTAHAEIVALRAAAARAGRWVLAGYTLVVTLEPCPMCAGAILAARIDTVVFGAWDDKAGAAGSRLDLLRDRTLPHRAEVYGGVEEPAAAEQLRRFFRERRAEGPRG